MSKEWNASSEGLQPEPVTRAEMEARIDQRRTPEVEPHLEPGSGLELTVKAEIDLDNERRIHFIRERLAALHGGIERDFGLAHDAPEPDTPQIRKSFAHVR